MEKGASLAMGGDRRGDLHGHGRDVLPSLVLLLAGTGYAADAGPPTDILPPGRRHL